MGNGVADVFNQAWSHHQAGRFAQAEQLYRQVLQADPRHVDAWCFLGAACQSQGRLAEAEMHFRQAVQLMPSHPSAANCLGIVLAQQNKVSEALASFQDALRFEPGSAELHNNLGLVYEQAGQTAEAIDAFRQALRLRPDYAGAYYNLGLTLSKLGQRDEAITQYRQALHWQPHYPEALNDLANALAEQEKTEDAVNSYRQALRLRPNYAEAHYNLGVVLGRVGRADEAIACYQQAVRFKPDYAEAYFNMGNVLSQIWKFDEAVRSYQMAVHCKPSFGEAHTGLGNVLFRQGRLQEALASFREALRIQPDLGVAQSNLLFFLNYDPTADPDMVFAEHCKWGKQKDQVGPACRAGPLQGQVPSGRRDLLDRRLRIGYVSPDLRKHAVTRYLEPILVHHDPEQVEVFCYAEVPHPDAVTTRLQKLVPHWRWTHKLTDDQLIQQIREDRIDILVDLAGHTAGNRLPVLARKPAPIQATWLGYMNTTGLTTVDYRLTDEVLDPPDFPVRDTEELVRLPYGMRRFAPPSDAPAISLLPARRRGHLTFGSLHNLFKINADVYDLWSKVLHALPTARLLMFRHTVSGTAREHTWRQFAERGIAAERLDLRQGSDGPGYLGIYDEIDMSLDVFPCTGGVTTCESLWMGVPVVSLCGVRPAGRNSAALLAGVGLSDWAVDTKEQYVNLAVERAQDVEGLAALRSHLRERMQTTLCDGRRFTRALEEAYRNMWRRCMDAP